MINTTIIIGPTTKILKDFPIKSHIEGQRRKLILQFQLAPDWTLSN